MLTKKQLINRGYDRHISDEDFALLGEAWSEMLETNDNYKNFGWENAQIIELYRLPESYDYLAEKLSSKWHLKNNFSNEIILGQEFLKIQPELYILPYSRKGRFIGFCSNEAWNKMTTYYPILIPERSLLAEIKRAKMIYWKYLPVSQRNKENCYLLFSLGLRTPYQRVVKEIEWYPNIFDNVALLNEEEAVRIIYSTLQKVSNYVEDFKGRTEPYGIYCAKLDGKIVYIGKTERSFAQRWEEHRQYLAEEPKWDSMKFYKKFHNRANDIVFEPMVDCTKEPGIMWSGDMIAAMECGFIQYFQPEGNEQGVDITYQR